MKKKIIFFVALLSVFMMLLMPNISAVENTFNVTVKKKNGESVGEGIYVQLEWDKTEGNHYSYKEYFGFTNKDGKITYNDRKPFFDKDIPSDATVKVHVYYKRISAVTRTVNNFEDITIDLPTNEPKNDWFLSYMFYKFLCMF